MNLFADLNWSNLTLSGFLDDQHIRENSFTYAFLNDRFKVPKNLKDKRNLGDDEYSEDEAEATGSATNKKDTGRRGRGKGHIDLDKPDSESDHESFRKVYVPGIVGNLPFPKHSSITKEEQAKFIQLHSKFMNKRLTVASNVSVEEQREFATYIELNNKVMTERAEFLSFLKDHWKIQSVKFNRLSTDIERYIAASWKHRIDTRPSAYPRYYSKVKAVPLVYQGEKNDVQLIPGDVLLQLGTSALVIHPNLRNNKFQISQDPVAVSKRFPPDCKQEDVDTSNTIYKLPVSEDVNAQQLGLAYDADVVISSSGLKAVANNHSDYGRSWDVPVTVRRYQPVDAADPVRTIVYVDKPLPRRAMTVADRCRRFHKLGVKMLWCHPKHNKSFRMSLPQAGDEPPEPGPADSGVNARTRREPTAAVDSDGSTSESDGSASESDDGGLRIVVTDDEAAGGGGGTARKRRRGAENVAHEACREDSKAKPAVGVGEKKRTFVEPAPRANVSYRLWTMKKEKRRKEELPRHMMKQPVGAPDKELRILVRNKLDGYVGIGRRKQVRSPMSVLPKMEYQSEYGGEKMTRTELINEWLTLKFRQGSRLTRVRVNAETSEVLLTENLTLEALTQEAKQLHGHTFVSDVASTLYSVLGQLVDLAPGQYLLTHSPAMQAFVMLMKGDRDFGSLDLHQMYSCVDTESPPSQEEMPWIEVDTGLTMPYHAAFGRVPGTFNPGKVVKPVKKVVEKVVKSPGKVVEKRKRKRINKKIKTRAAKKAVGKK